MEKYLLHSVSEEKAEKCPQCVWWTAVSPAVQQKYKITHRESCSECGAAQKLKKRRETRRPRRKINCSLPSSHSEKPLLVMNLLTHRRNHADDQGYSFLLVNASILNTALGIQLKHQQRIQRQWRVFFFGGRGVCFLLRLLSPSERQRVTESRPQTPSSGHLRKDVFGIHFSEPSNPSPQWGGVWSHKCHSEKDFLVCREETKPSKFPFNFFFLAR